MTRPYFNRMFNSSLYDCSSSRLFCENVVVTQTRVRIPFQTGPLIVSGKVPASVSHVRFEIGGGLRFHVYIPCCAGWEFERRRG